MTMNLTQSPWHKLAELPGRKAVLAEWENFPKGFLTLTRETATAIPCRGSCSCYRQVIRHGAGDFVGVCSSYPVRCDRIPLNRREVTLYRLNHKYFFEVVNSAIGSHQVMEELDWAPNLWRIGTIDLYADKTVPVFSLFYVANIRYRTGRERDRHEARWTFLIAPARGIHSQHTGL